MADYAVHPDHVTVIRPGRPDLAAQAAPTPATPDPDEPPLILSVGLLHPRKGHDILIDALSRIADHPWRAVIVGAPWAPGHADALSQQIVRAGLSDRIELAGRVERATLDQLYRQAYAFALATRYEGYGIVFDEALIHGLPIVSTTAAAVPGTVPAAAGTLVPPEDASGFAAALGTLLQDSTLHATQSAAASRAGASLPLWSDAARDVGAILDRIADQAT
jgi:glycosyltransferase involved in cell wall biosynthesis